MQSALYFRLAAAVVAVVLAIAAIAAWHADRLDRAQLAAELASTKQLLAAADSRQHDRDTQLAQTLAALAVEKRTIITPAQIIRELPKNLELPAPITLQSSPQATQAAHEAANQPEPQPKSPARGPNAPILDSPHPQAVIPAEDLKPLYDFTLNCKACQAKLAAAQSDLSDERNKTAALTKERDDALHIAKGGSAWRRIGRAAKWFILGAAAGAVLSKTHSR
jgi:hypothetical protein